MRKTEYVTASELGTYIYCKRGWWLSFHGKQETTAQMIEGTKQHNLLARLLRMNKKELTIALVLIAIGISILIIVGLSMIIFK